MFPFWNDVVAPIVEAAGARRIVEIGALRGENTELMLGRLGPDVELHVIDPLPNFDPAEHEARFPGQYVFHQDLSVNVLGSLAPMDVALIDGDHNWFTVHTELRLLAEVARAASEPLPVCVLHDVAWPYGRRDLYYDPDTIPEEHRQPWRRAGMRPGNPGLLQGQAGMNPTLANAEVEGGPRNGVMTGVDDFVAGYDRPLRVVFIPIYFGLAVVVEEERLARQPELAAVLDRLESNEGKDLLLRLGEDIRLEAAVFDQALVRQRDDRIDRLTSRYLASTKRGILNDFHAEDEVRIHHLLAATAKGRPFSPDTLRDPARHAPANLDVVLRRHQTGERIPLQTDAAGEHRVDDAGLARQGYAVAGRAGLDHLHECLDAVWATLTRGDIAVCGVGHGASTIFAAAYLQARDLDPRPVFRRKLWVADRFRATDGYADLNTLRDALARFDLLDETVRLLHGDPAATLGDIAAEQLALLHVGPGLDTDVATVLDRLYPRLARDGVVVVEDLDDPGVREAVEAFRARHGITTPLGHAGRAGAHWVKEQALGEPGVAPAAAPSHTSRSPLARRAGPLAPELSVVVTFFDMQREAARSLHALSRRYQRGLDDTRYEVVVVENGSGPDQRLGEELVRRYGRNFRYVDLGSDATPSPATAMNRGIDAANGRALALMIDGAHVLTPGVLHHGLAGLAAYEPAVVLTQPWYVGPGQQGDVMRSGYDQAVEDQLFERIDWPSDGYRLFDIGHFQGDRDWFDGLWESNCLFVGRELLEQVGGYDEGYAMPGGGYTNLEFYERLASTPGVNVVSIIGEGSFHQVHGGTTTNQPDPLERRNRITGYAEHHAELRGRPFMGPEKPVHFVGGFRTDAAKRSRSRRMTAEAFEVDLALEGEDGPVPSAPVPVADDLRDAFTNAYYRSLAWQRSKWLGRTVRNAATDLLTYQELVHDVRPDWIIETGSLDGGRALFLASVCDLLDHGRIVSVENVERPHRPVHPRVTYLHGVPHRPEVVDQVRSIVGPAPHALVILGTRGTRDRTRREFDAYAELVPVGSYVVVEHTVLNGFPVDATAGPGPHEALRRIMNVHGEFLADTEREKHSLTFNTGGFLKRIK